MVPSASSRRASSGQATRAPQRTLPYPLPAREGSFARAYFLLASNGSSQVTGALAIARGQIFDRRLGVPNGRAQLANFARGGAREQRLSPLILARGRAK